VKLLKIYIFVFSVAILGSSCGKKSPPPPPKVRSTLLLGLYDAMDNRRHEDALKKIARLRKIAPSDVFLANLEKCERNNSILMQAQEMIDAGNVKGACESVSDGIIKYGRHPELMDAKKKLDVANKINAILKVFKKPYDSTSLRNNALMLKKIASTYKPAKIFLPLSEKELIVASKLKILENKNAIDGLCSQIASLLAQKEDINDNHVEVLYAVLEIADPKNEALLQYRDYIAGKRNAFPGVYKEEDIFDSLTNNAPPENFGSEKKKYITPLITETTDIEENSEKDTTTKESIKTKKEPEGWWRKFSF
jgi:hypothetical protein